MNALKAKCGENCQYHSEELIYIHVHVCSFVLAVVFLVAEESRTDEMLSELSATGPEEEPIPPETYRK